MDRTHQLIQKAQMGDATAKSTLVEENSGLIWSIVRRFKGRGHELEDLYQIGAIGLLKCIDKFDTSYEVKFSTYAVPMILGEIKRFLRDDGMIKVSRPLKELAVKARYMRETLMHETGKEISVGDLAEKMGISPEELTLAMEADREIESIYATVYQNDNGNPVYMVDKLEQTEENGDRIVDYIALKEILGKLDAKERQIIIMRYFEDKTQTEIAKKLKISQVQVSRMEKRVLANIREKLKLN